MTPVRKHIRFLSKALLLVGYFFLFSTQTNYRFYSIANFFDYHRASHLLVTAKGSADLSTCVPSRIQAHLGIDKRYAAKHFVKLPFTAFSAIAPYKVVARIYYVPLKVCASSDLLPTNALRGPPCA
jgi:hypothetical protein